MTMGTRTLFVDLARLAADRDGITVTIIALVCNDLAIANSSMAHYGQIRDRMSHIRRGGGMYFSRVSCDDETRARKSLDGNAGLGWQGTINARFHSGRRQPFPRPLGGATVSPLR